jgi:hypothetical protein
MAYGSLSLPWFTSSAVNQKHKLHHEGHEVHEGKKNLTAKERKRRKEEIVVVGRIAIRPCWPQRTDERIHHEGHEEHEVYNQKKSEAFVSFVHFVVKNWFDDWEHYQA